MRLLDHKVVLKHFATCNLAGHKVRVTFVPESSLSGNKKIINI